jgi:hypothetical protein
MQTEFHLKWINYLDKDLTWRKIKPNFVKTTSGFEMTQAPFEAHAPLTADGVATFINNNRWDVHGQRLIDEMSIRPFLRFS